MATWVITENEAGIQPITETSTTQNHPLGKCVKAKDISLTVPLEGEFQYAKGVASTIATDWCVLNADDGGTVRLVTLTAGKVGVAMSANVASQYGWYQIKGKAIGGSGGAIVDGAPIYAHGTAGLVDDAVVDGDLIHGAKCCSTVSGASITGEYDLSYPFTTATTGAD